VLQCEIPDGISRPGAEFRIRRDEEVGGHLKNMSQINVLTSYFGRFRTGTAVAILKSKRRPAFIAGL
jgi:hypothetical protein